MQVSPEQSLLGKSSYKHNRVRLVFAILCLWLNLIAGICYLSIIKPYCANDLFWPQYNTSGYQTFFIDSVNALLQLPNNVSLAQIVIEKSYSASTNIPQPHPAYPMMLLTTQLITLEHAIENLRNATPETLPWLPIQHCWVDFNQTWELAHTVLRQKRCSLKYYDNGAVYLESILRNTNWGHLLHSTLPWQNTLLAELDTSSLGKHWISTTSSANFTLNAEVAYWKSHRISKFQLQWQDTIFPGLDQSIDIINTIGVVFPVLIKSTIRRYNVGGSAYFSSHLGNDLLGVDSNCNATLIKNLNTSLNKVCEIFNDTSSTTLDIFSLFNTSQATLLYTALGPTTTSDLWVVPVPGALTNLVIPLLSDLYSLLIASPELTTSYSQLQTIITAPTPPNWTGDFVYYGGNPICVTTLMAESFVQSSIAFDDACQSQEPLTITMTPPLATLALLLTHNTTTIESICDLQSSPLCVPTLQKARELTRFMSTSSPAQSLATMAIHQLNISIMQFASNFNQVNYTLLRQPLLDLDSPWTFYGWIMLFDWVQGRRDVISLEGDNGTLVLMSEAYSTASLALSKGSLTNASTIVYYILVYFTTVTMVLGVVGTLASFRCQSENLFFFHRIVGSTWIGRPLMFLRGATAIVLLGSIPLRLKYNDIATRFDTSPRLWIESVILSSEATWISVVVHELLVPFTSRKARTAGNISTALAWLICLVLDIFSPIDIVTKFEHQCNAIDMTSQLYCSSGAIEIGSFNRVLVLFLIQIVGVLSIVFIGNSCTMSRARRVDSKLVSGSAQAFLLPPLDRLGEILDGLIPLPASKIIDIKLWTIPSKSLKKELSVGPSFSEKIMPKVSRWSILVLIASISFLAIDIFSSISYLQLLQVNLPNDLVWRNFNITGVHVFLSTCLLESLPFFNSTDSFAFNDATINYPGQYNLKNPVITFNGHIGARMQYTELTTLTAAIVALRKLDACEAPWLFTQYCYLDFDKRWEMANSARRQERCINMIDNAAVFLEATLRNIEWNAFELCWGKAFDIGFGQELRQSTSGMTFLQSLHRKASVSNELTYWKQYNFSSYKLQWQNYKYIGAINSYTITNAYGVSYPLIISATKGLYRWNDQSSLKMYWAFGNDLKSLLDNSTALVGKSLIRSSGQFAFGNTSLNDVNPDPLDFFAPPKNALQSFLGPFGSIDMIYVGVPWNAQQVARQYLQFIKQIRREEPTLYFNVSTFKYRSPVPSSWQSTIIYDVHGSILCPLPSSTGSILGVMSIAAFDFDTICDSALMSSNSDVVARVNNIIFATIFANLNTSVAVADVCTDISAEQESCQESINRTLDLLSQYSPSELYSTWAAQLYESVHSLNIEWMQLGREILLSPTQVFHRRILSHDDKYDFLAWNALFDWIIGDREVVSFQGDNGNLTLLGNVMHTFSQPVETSQMPTLFALFAQRGVQYVTFVIIALASLTFMYIISSSGRVEGMNLFKVSSIGGLVWIGRPLIFVRSLTALCLLSTANVILSIDNGISYFSYISEPWYTTCLAANEVTWLVGIVNDFFIVYTNEWTQKYAFINSIVVWVASALLATLLPVEPTITIDPQCQIDTLDFQIDCHLGDVEIGSLVRLLSLCLLVLMSNCICIILVRCIWKQPDQVTSSSLLLCGSARFLFNQHHWKYGGVLYLDTASAVINGLLSFRYQRRWFVFDIKTWRLHRIEQAGNDLISAKFYRAIPLQDD